MVRRGMVRPQLVEADGQMVRPRRQGGAVQQRLAVVAVSYGETRIHRHLIVRRADCLVCKKQSDALDGTKLPSPAEANETLMDHSVRLEHGQHRTRWGYRQTGEEKVHERPYARA